ncbi:substrate-binding periplasmic protein [Rugamonas sp. CCM 8940]|uniref:substrate-binding periplasmic protein n=1 Tax=Rugamonas sp. CCM 8940 TaxID=2765359 RepID=UPI0018F53D39|nr:transporter substrate-binding domain-containing protein [Rugamonas sp. CCM 8940]MBJ7313537.1 transporter substrate-binding domain-containing protein [Rugamonas sp. CCM 8940]
MQRKILASLLGLLLGLPLADCLAQQLVIGAEDDWAPYSSNVDGQARGFAVDVVREAYAAVGLNVTFKVLPYVRCMAMARLGEISGCFDAVPNHLIAERYLWHDKPLFTTRMNVYALAGSAEHGLRARDFEGKTVGVTRDYEYGDVFDLNEKIVREVGTKNEQGFRKLLAGRMQYMAAEERIAKALFARYPAQFCGKFKEVGTVDTPGLYIAFSKFDPAAAGFLHKFNEGYALLHKNGRYKELETRWFGALMSQPCR